MLRGSLHKLKKRAVELDLNLVFTEEDAKEEEAEEEEEEEEEDEAGEEQRQSCSAGGEDLYLQKEGREVLGFGEPPGGIGTSAKQGKFRQECDDKDSMVANDWKLNLEAKERESTAIQASSLRGCVVTGEHQHLREARLTDYLELCQKQGRFSPKRCIMDGLEEGHGKLGASSGTVEKDCCNFRDDGPSLNLEEKSHYHDDGACEGDAMEPAAATTTRRRRTRSRSPMSPPGKKRYATADPDDAFRSRKQRPHHHHHRKSPVKTMMNNEYAWARAHSLVGEGDPFSRRLIVEQDHLRSPPRESLSRMHIKQNLSESPPKGDPSSARPIIEPDHHDSRSPTDFPANQHYQDLSPALLSPQGGSRFSIRDSFSKSPPCGYRHSHRTRYSPQRGNSQRQSPQTYRSKKQPWIPPPNRSNGIGTPGRNLFIAGFSFNTTERDLERKFSLYGEVQDVRIVRDKRSGDSRGFGFLSLGHDAAADEAIRNLDRAEWNGRIILVEKAKSLD